MIMEKNVLLKFEAAANAAPVAAVMEFEAPSNLPDGQVGQVLTKTADGVVFADLAKSDVPAVGALEDGDYKITVTDGVATWVKIVA